MFTVTLAPKYALPFTENACAGLAFAIPTLLFAAIVIFPEVPIPYDIICNKSLFDAACVSMTLAPLVAV